LRLCPGTDTETPCTGRDTLGTGKEALCTGMKTPCTGMGAGRPLSEQNPPSNGTDHELVGALDGVQQVMARIQKQVRDQSVQTGNDLNYNQVEKSDLNENKTNDDVITKQTKGITIDLPQAGAKHQTIKEYFSNLSPAVNNNGDHNMWQERARIEKENLKNKIEGNSDGKYQSRATTDKQRGVKAKRKLQFKEVSKSVNKNKEIPSENSSDHFHYDGQHPSLSTWLEDLSLPISAVRRLEEEELRVEDMLELMSREDLSRIGLKKGPELRIWQKVQMYRQTRGKNEKNPGILQI